MYSWTRGQLTCVGTCSSGEIVNERAFFEDAWCEQAAGGKFDFVAPTRSRPAPTGYRCPLRFSTRSSRARRCSPRAAAPHVCERRTPSPHLTPACCAHSSPVARCRRHFHARCCTRAAIWPCSIRPPASPSFRYAHTAHADPLPTCHVVDVRFSPSLWLTSPPTAARGGYAAQAADLASEVAGRSEARRGAAAQVLRTRVAQCATGERRPPGPRFAV